MKHLIIAIIIIPIFELIFNYTWFAYLKKYFNFEEDNQDEKIQKTFLGLNLSTFKGIMERIILTTGLLLGYNSILIVFGTLKLGTRFKDSQDVKNDYFLIGNFSSILIALFYSYFIAICVQ